MPYLTNEIGPHEFVTLEGNPIEPADVIGIDDRPGVDGTEFTLEGVKGRPFTMLSKVDAPSYTEARITMSVYMDLIGAEAVDLIISGVNCTVLGYRVKVLNVRERIVTAISRASGNCLNPPSRAWLEALWDLIAIPVEEEEE